MSDFHNNPVSVKARKQWKCSWCGDEIPKGSDHTLQTGHFDGRFYATRWHTECRAACEKYMNQFGEWDEGWEEGGFARGCMCEKGRCDCRPAPTAQGETRQ